MTSSNNLPDRRHSVFGLWLLRGLAVLLVVEMHAADLPADFAETQIASGLDPTSMAFAPDGRLFVTEKNGKIRVIKNGELLTAPFVTLTVDNYNERGLQSVAFDPDFATNGFLYAYYATPSPQPHNRVSRFTANGDGALPGSELVLLELENLTGSVHNGGALHLHEGKLFISSGDSGTAGNSQNLATKLGKILRINPDGSVPANNPFFNTPNAQQSVWALGLRNPFTFAFQPGTGRMFINDVGQAAWEEINEGIAGSNYGWPNSEGYTNQPGQRTPFYAYPHSQGCAVTGGVFYNPAFQQFPANLVGRYFFADYCNGIIYTIDPANAADVQIFATNVARAIDLDVAPDGALYYLSRGGLGGGSVQDNTSSSNGAVFRVAFTGTQGPSIAIHPQNATVPVGESAAFAVAASGTPPLSFQWRRNTLPIEGATAAALDYGPVALGDDGVQFDCAVTNSFGAATSAAATLSVTTNTRPAATILTPPSGALYRGGESIVFSGSANDTEDGALPASAFTWRIDFHHDEHVHPAMAAVSGITSGSFAVPNAGEPAADVFHRVYLTVLDSGGLARTAVRDVLPRTANLHFTTSPAGLQIILDGQPLTTPFTVLGVSGVQRSVELANPHIAGGAAYRFTAWSDGGTAAHTITTPDLDSSYTASFAAVPGGVGTGLEGEYFTNQDRTFHGVPAVTRTDATVDFDWVFGSPDPAVSWDNFTVRWSGQVQPQFTETYTFFTTTDDGVRLYVDGQLLIDKFVFQPATPWSGSIALAAGQKYDVLMEFFEGGYHAVAKLSWSSLSVPLQIVPADRLFPVATHVTISANDPFAQEATGNSGGMLVTRTGPAEADLEVNFTLSGAATMPADFTVFPAASVTIPAGQLSAQVALIPASDSVVEGSENAVFTLAGGFGYSVVLPLAATVQIEDSPLDLWKVARFGSVANAQLPVASDLADWDFDGGSNLIEYALNMDAAVAGIVGLPALDHEDIGGSEYLTLTFQRTRPAPVDVSYFPEVSPDLQTWTAAVMVAGYPFNNGDGTETVKVRDTVPVPDAERRFMRLRVTRP